MNVPRGKVLRSPRTTIITTMVLLMVLCVLMNTSAMGPGVRRPDPVLDLATSLDCPVLGALDFWNYTTDFSVDILGFTVPFTGWLNMSVVQVVLDPSLDMAPVYILDMTGNVSGHLIIPFLPDIDIYLDLDGYSWNKVQDLSVYRSVLNASVSGSIPSLNGFYPFGYEFSPPLEEYDFPLTTGDSWWTNVSARLPFGGSGDLFWMNGSWSLYRTEQMTVPAGTFMVIPISMDGTMALFYNATVGNTVMRTYELDIDGTVISVPLKLESYGRHSSDQGISLKVTSPQPLLAGTNFKIVGTTTVSNTAVTLLFPDGNVAAFIPLYLGDRDFEATIKAPEFPDDTPTQVDHGSFGILAVLGPLDAMAVTTVTTWATDAMVDNDSLMVAHTGEGTVDDSFTAHIHIRNPSNYGIGGLRITLNIEDLPLELLNVSDASIPAGEVLELSVDVDVATDGHFNLTLRVDPGNTVPEMDETNNVVTVGLTVLERPPIIWTVDPPADDFSIAEGGWALLSASAIRGNDILGGKWTIDGAVIEVNVGPLNFTTNYTGMRSSRADPYEVAFSLDEGQTFDGEQGAVSWRITVKDVDRPPKIPYLHPVAREVWMDEGETQLFSVEASDPDGDALLYVWDLNGNVLPVHGPAFAFTPGYSGLDSSEGSPFELVLNISDDAGPKGSTRVGWTIYVNDTDRPFQFSLDPSPGNLTVGYEEGIVLTYNASDLDGTPVASVWYYLGRSLHNASRLTFDPDKLGLSGGESVHVRLELSSGAHSFSAAWNLSVLDRPIPPPVQPPKDVMILSPKDGEAFKKGENVTLEAASTDTRPLDYVWEADGVVHRGSTVVLEGLDIGRHEVVLRVYLQEDTSMSVTLHVNFSVAIEDRPAPPDDDKDRPSLLWFLLLIPLILAIVIPLAWTLLRRKDGEFSWEE